MIKEQVEGIGGVLRWISSERQFGDGFTKMAARQLLADRIRHGAIKFTFDPGYTASKKKTAAQRAKSRNEFTTTTNHNQPSHNHNAANEDVPVYNMSPVSNAVDENDLIPENNMVPEDAIVSENVEISEYTMMAEYAAVSEETFARPSHGARPIFQFLLAAVLPMISGGTDLVPFGSGLESRQCEAAEEFAYHRADKSWWPLLVSFAVFLALLSGIISLIWRRATQHVRQRLLEAESTILDLSAIGEDSPTGPSRLKDTTLTFSLN